MRFDHRGNENLRVQTIRELSRRLLCKETACSVPLFRCVTRTSICLFPLTRHLKSDMGFRAQVDESVGAAS